jgi:tRNA dimethylallyltransferase
LDVDVVARVAALAEDGTMLAIVGPTASGKTELAIRLAERLGGEIVSADSVQIYHSFDVGSGKPTPEERRRAPHHLVDALDPLEPVDAAAYATLASAAIADVRARGKVAILCGGTFLWVKALLFGLSAAPPASPEIRTRHKDLATGEGRPALHAMLAGVDPQTAARLHPNDLVRVSRALEVYELTGRPMSAWQAEHGFATTRHPARLVAIARDPSALTARVRARILRWLATGWIEEVLKLEASGYGEARAMGSVGYREVRAHVRGEIGAGDLAESIVRATRVFARRQRTWLNHAEVLWLDAAVDADERC